MIVTKGYGFRIEEINRSCPTDMQPYIDAYQKECDEKEAFIHLTGVYVMDALRATVGNMLAGKGHKPFEYPKKPYSQTNSRKAKAEQLFAQLNTAKANFELAKMEKQNEGN